MVTSPKERRMNCSSIPMVTTVTESLGPKICEPTGKSKKEKM
jgi:hypothetical protein